jgi:hypothetical protein
MMGEWRRKPKPKVTSRMACKALAGSSVTLGGHGKSRCKMRQTKRTAEDVVQGATKIISPDNKIAGLEFIEA